MAKNAMRRNLRQSIVKSLGRYIAITAIIALGAALFVGLLMTKSNMVATGQVFMDEQNMFDLRLVNSYGWTEDYLDEVARLEQVVELDKVVYLDIIGHIGETDSDTVYRFMAIPEKLNRIALRGGRMPENEDECLISGFGMDDSILGQTIVVSDSNEESTLESIRHRNFTIVGMVATPLYMDMNRGTTNVGSGSLQNVLYVDPAVLDMDYFQEINITIAGDYDIYTQAYSDALEEAADAMEPQLQELADRRLVEVRKEAIDAYKDGLNEYYDGEREYLDGKAQAEQELEDAYQELVDGEQQLVDTEKMLKDGEHQLELAKQALMEGEKTLEESKKTLTDSKAQAYKELSQSTQNLMLQFQEVMENSESIRNDLTEVQGEILVLNAQITPLETQRNLSDIQISQTKSNMDILLTTIETNRTSLEMQEQLGADEAELEELRQQIAEDEARWKELNERLDQQLAARLDIENQLAPLYEQRTALELREAELQAENDRLGSIAGSLTTSLLEISVTKTVMEEEFAAAEAQIESAESQIEAGYLELDIQASNIKLGWEQLEEGKVEIADGWKEYEKGKEEVRQELADAKKKLDEGAAELVDAWDTISQMTENEAMILNRTSNLGYNNLDSSSDIVQGVSRVLPVFFILVASLVCITTMTRMIDEERTQIGTLKALGYSNAAIISKYLFYSGSGAVIGCVLGIAVGCTIFPQIIWQAYKIMLYITPGMVLTMNWALSLAVIVVYTAILLFVTWYCCRRALQEVPAELIRPKSPDPGKKLLIERLPFWHAISFLNKVTIRNIFRYRQRLAMMMVGIGGCTALLLTGFGLRDSIVNVVDYQFQEVTHYDLQVYFNDAVEEDNQLKFAHSLGADAEDTLFYHQSSVELVMTDRMKEIYMICADENLETFIDLHSGSKDLSVPGKDQVVLSVGVAEALGIETGDTITLRDADLRTMEVTVSGIYDNHVYNYCIISPETYHSQFGLLPEIQMAMVKAAEGADIHKLAVTASEQNGVMNVSVSEDMANMVRGMMDALDLVVWVIVFCAGLLAVIVLYNLTNININERIREIATIKVLGFRASETGSYVFKENLVLTVAGSVFGLGLGYLMLVFVMSQIKIDMVWFKPLIMFRSYVWSIVLTILSAIVVDFIFYFKLDKINMAEALKSVE